MDADFSRGNANSIFRAEEYGKRKGDTDIGRVLGEVGVGLYEIPRRNNYPFPYCRNEPG
jgi:hypothetical protein